MPRTKSILFRTGVVLLSLFLSLLAIEVALRTVYAIDRKQGGTLEEQLERSKTTRLGDNLGPFSIAGLIRPSPHHDIVYELKPGLDGTFRDAPIRTSSQGLRDRAFSVEKPPGVYRIAGLGDSIMFGWGVDNDSPFLKVLERRLNELDDERNFEVMNFAVPGYNSAMEVEVFFQRVLPFNPDLVIMQFVSNDLGAPMLMKRDPDHRKARTSYLWALIQSRTGWGIDIDDINAKHGNLFRDKDMKRWDDKDERADVLDRYDHLVGSKSFKEAMRRMGAAAKERGIQVIILSGKFYRGQKNLVERVCEEHGFFHVNVANYTGRYLRLHNINTDSKRAVREVTWVRPGDSHPSARAHTIYADSLMDALGAMDIIDYNPVLPEEVGLAPKPQ